MRVAMFSTKPYDRRSFDARNGPFGHELHYSRAAARRGYGGAGARLPRRLPVRQRRLRRARRWTLLADGGTRLVALRCAGFNNVDLAAAARLGHPRRARAGLLAPRGGRVHGRHDPDPQPPDPPRLQPHPREQFRARRPARLRSASARPWASSAPARSAPWSRAPCKLGFGCEVLAHDVAAGPRARSPRRPLLSSRTSSPPAPTSSPCTARSRPQTRHIINARSIAR